MYCLYQLTCDANLLTFRTLADFYQVPVFAIDVPWNQTKENVQYVADQLRDLKVFLEKNTGKTISEDRLKERLVCSKDKYLGMPYVWGGSSPETSFDCSGFVSYVFTNSGVCNMGRLTAQGIYDICMPVSPEEARPGDIIFFTGTYDAGEPVTHVGIYAGDGQMIHCGNPIQYTSINSAYWQSHFYAFGRP